MLTRFAPSPTGNLHLGNIRTALLCYLYAKNKQGKFLLRIDDTDTARSKQEYVENIKADLAWLGINPDDMVRQSDRFDRYELAINKLKAEGRLYAAYETVEELEFKRKMQLGRGQPPVYDRAALELSSSDIAKFEAEGRKPHWRFKLNHEEVIFNDEIKGEVKINLASTSDPILIRENGVYTYMLPSTVDDIELGATHVLRGEDHTSNTAVQVQIFRALGATPPNFAHLSLIKSEEGKLSKRKQSEGVAKFKEEGITPIAINSFLARVGTSNDIALADNMEQLIAEFDINKFSKSPTIYSIDDIKRLNVKVIHSLSYMEVKGLISSEITEDFWNVARANIENIEQVEDWWKICKNPVKADLSADDREFLQAIADLLPTGEFDVNSWSLWLNAIKADKQKVGDRKGKTLFMPIRKALTGMEHGPELKDLLPLIGRETVLTRLINS